MSVRLKTGHFNYLLICNHSDLHCHYETVQQALNSSLTPLVTSYSPISTSFWKLMHPNYKSYHLLLIT